VRLARFIAEESHGAPGERFEDYFVRACRMAGLSLERNSSNGRLWDIRSYGDGWERIVSDEFINIKISTTKWMFSSAELYHMLPWESVPDDFDPVRAAAKVKRFLNRTVAGVVFLKPASRRVERALVAAVDAEDRDAVEEVLVKKNFLVERLGKKYDVRVIVSDGRITSIAIDKGGKVFMRTEKPRKLGGSVTVTFRTPTPTFGKAGRVKNGG
jgi:hypothetical protein